MRDAVYGNRYYGSRNTTFHKYGPNVCMIEEVISDNGGGLSAYKYRGWTLHNHQSQTCSHNTIVKYECCEGFKSTYGHSGCTVVKSPKNVLETARELGACEFVRYIQRHGLYDLLTSGGPYTIFVPTDEAFAKMDSKLRSALESYESATEILKYHVVPRRIVTQNVSVDEMLDTLNDGLQLRFNKYSTKIDTVNCVTLTRKNSIAQNGMVHLINNVLNPYSYSKQNLVQTINQNKELSIFSQMLKVSLMHQSLKETFQTLTVLAPTDTTLRLLPQKQLHRIFCNETLSREFVLKHIIPASICLNAVTEERYVKSLSNKHYLKFGCDGAGSVTVQGNCIGNKLKLSSNGLLYSTNFALSTQEGKSALQIMQQNAGLSEFVKIVNIAGLTQTFENFNALTIFAPTNQAIRCMDHMERHRIQSDLGTARAFVNFHATREIVTAENIYDGKTVESLAHGKQLRLQCVQNEYGVEGRQVDLLTSPVAYNGAVYEIDSVLYPPTISIEDIIRKNDSFSLYAQATDLLTRTLRLERYHRGCQNTYFVPTDYAFQKLGTEELERILNSPAQLQNILNNHRAERILPSTLVNDRWQYEVQTKNGIVRIAHSKDTDKITVNNAKIIETDIMTTDGLVYIVDDLILL
ncbi:FAS1 domain [Cinara cedri]|uniref:FAS1 domain n=1 Tax=Cinara cedri TaxID=506608 RepID=A0A5E4MZ80_9HEMI|nr:FAS1 domain [Cinara cedri]